MKKSLIMVLACSSALNAIPAHAQEKQTLPAVTVTAEQSEGTATVPSNAEAMQLIQQTPGGVEVVDAESYEDKYSLNLADTLEFVPGVYAQKRFGEEVRLSIRGSGLSRGFHLRGLTLLQDGIPFNLADGAADFQEADTLAYQRLEVFKGANALQYGSTTLGGAVNMVTKTGHSNPGDQVRVEAGSDSTYRANVQSGRVFGDQDMFVSLTGTTSDGYRRHEDQQNIKLNTNYGKQISDKAETRFYLSGNIIEQELPGSVSRFTALNNPRAADPSSISADQRRDIRSLRLANKTTFDLGNESFADVGAFVNLKDLFHPITPFVGVIDQESVDYGIFAQNRGEYEAAGYRNRYRAGLSSHFGTVAAKVWGNVGGSRGPGLFNPNDLQSDADQDSRNVTLYGENDFFVLPEWALVTGGQLVWSEREHSDNLIPAESDSRTYRSINPKVGVLYEPSDNLQVFANISKSYEPPTFSELTQGGTVGFTPVDAQRGWTAEIGTRGSRGAYAWDASIYRAWLDDEMLQYTVGPGFPAATFNAGETIHQGLELAFTSRLGQNLFTSGDQIQWKNAYTYSDFFFENDPQFGDNDIPGMPKHYYQTELRYDHADAWHVAMDWELASKADVDFANTFTSPGYGIIGANAGYKLTQDVSLYVDGRNLMDKEYAATFSTIVNQAGNTNVFHPGEGRRVFAGVKVNF